jgi:hypothetical protein
MDPDVTLKRFDKEGSGEKDEGEAGPSALNERDWRQMGRLVRSAVRDEGAKESKQLSLSPPSPGPKRATTP